MYIPILTPIMENARIARAVRSSQLADAQSGQARAEAMRGMWDGYAAEAAKWADNGSSGDRDWKVVGGKQFLSPDDEDVSEQADVARRLYWESVTGFAVVEALVRSVFGKGFKFKTREKLVQEVWKEFTKANRWGRREVEVGRRALRDGECFIRKFSGVWPPKLRFVEPKQVADAGNFASTNGVAVRDGIVFAPGDAETPIKYLKMAPDGTPEKPIEAEQIQHIKILVDLAVPRGIPLLFVCRDYVKHLERTAIAMSWKAYISACHVLVQKFTGATPRQLAALAASMDDETITEGKNDMRGRDVRPGMMTLANENISYEWQGPSIGADEQEKAARELGLKIGAAEGLPEHIVRGDASNANRASLQVAAASGLVTFEYWQDLFVEEFEILWDWVMAEAKRIGRLPAGINTEVEIHAPKITTSTLKELVEALEIAHQNGMLSVQTASTYMGLDYDGEQRMIEEHDARTEDRTVGPVPRGGGEEPEDDEGEGEGSDD